MNPASPYHQPPVRGYRIISATLRVVVAVQTWGAGLAHLRTAGESALATALKTSYEVDPLATLRLDQGIGAALLIAGIFALTRPCLPVLIPVALVMAADTGAATVPSEGVLLVLEPLEHAVRIVAPLALAVIDWWPPALKFSVGRFCVSLYVLRMAAGISFLGHGLLAVWAIGHGGPAAESVQSVLSRLPRVAPDDDQVHVALAVIAMIDGAFALSFVTVRSRGVALWMGLWGLLLAAISLIHHGPLGYDRFMIQAALGGGPLVIFLYWRLSVRQPPSELIADLPPQDG